MAKRIVNLYILIVLCVIPLIITPGSFDYYYHPKITSIYFLSLVMAVFYFFRMKDLKIEKEPSDYFLFIYIIIVFISTIFSVDIVQSIQGNALREEGFAAIVCYAFIYFIAAKYYSFSRKHVKYFILAASIIALYGIMQYLGYNIIKPDIIRKTWIKHSYSTIGNRNFLASYLVLVLPISIFAYLHTKSLYYLISSCMLYLCLLCTLTRGAWIGFVVSIGVFIYYISKYKYNIKSFSIVITLFVLISIAFNFYSNGELFDRAFSIEKDISSVIKNSSENGGSNRIFIWKRILKLIGERPLLGSGPDTIEIVFMKEFSEDIKNNYGHIVLIDKAHNEYLQIAAATGIPSVLLYLTFIAAILIKNYRAANKKIIMVPIFCCLIGYMVQAFFNISVVSVAPVYWAVLGISSKLADEDVKL